MVDGNQVAFSLQFPVDVERPVSDGTASAYAIVVEVEFPQHGRACSLDIKQEKQTDILHT